MSATREYATEILRRLDPLYSELTTGLNFSTPLELLVATILSAQCTDERVNMVTPALFARYQDARAYADADREALEEMIHSCGFYRNKARNIQGMAVALVERHGGEVPEDLDALTNLPGVGRKTANVVRGVAFGLASGIVVDTHVKRLARRLGLAKGTTPEQIERELMQLIPRSEWVDLSHRLIQHGRRVCLARRPRCHECSLAELCPMVGVATGRPDKAPPGRRASGKGPKAGASSP
jgi:endonuclease-3